MVKSKGGYTSQMKARVQYPAMRSKKAAAPTATTAAVTASKTNGVSENIAAAAPADNSRFNRKIEGLKIFYCRLLSQCIFIVYCNHNLIFASF